MYFLHRPIHAGGAGDAAALAAGGGLPSPLLSPLPQQQHAPTPSAPPQPIFSSPPTNAIPAPSPLQQQQVIQPARSQPPPHVWAAAPVPSAVRPRSSPSTPRGIAGSPQPAATGARVSPQRSSAGGSPVASALYSARRVAAAGPSASQAEAAPASLLSASFASTGTTGSTIHWNRLRAAAAAPPPPSRLGKDLAARKRGYSFASRPPPPAPAAAAAAAAAAANIGAGSTSRGPLPQQRQREPSDSFSSITTSVLQPTAAAPAPVSSGGCLCTAVWEQQSAAAGDDGSSKHACGDCGAGFGFAYIRFRHEHCSCCGSVFCSPCAAGNHPLLRAASHRLCAGCAFTKGATDEFAGAAIAAAQSVALGVAGLSSPAVTVPQPRNRGDGNALEAGSGTSSLGGSLRWPDSPPQASQHTAPMTPASGALADAGPGVAALVAALGGLSSP
jgi:hypothetical protein